MDKPNDFLTEHEDFVVRAVGLIWKLYYGDDYRPEQDPRDMLRVISYSCEDDIKCVLLGEKDTECMTFEVIYNGAKKETNIAQYMELSKHVFTDEQLDKQ